MESDDWLDNNGGFRDVRVHGNTRSFELRVAVVGVGQHYGSHEGQGLKFSMSYHSRMDNCRSNILRSDFNLRRHSHCSTGSLMINNGGRCHDWRTLLGCSDMNYGAYNNRCFGLRWDDDMRVHDVSGCSSVRDCGVHLRSRHN
jgi:hypothetical protein